MSPTTNQRYIVHKPSLDAAKAGFSSLKLTSVPIPSVGQHEVLVRIHAVCLNFRDIMVATGTYIWPTTDSIVPCSDGAGQVVAVGERVTHFQVGDKVASTFFQPGQFVSLGAEMDGMLQEYTVLHELGLVKVPEHLSMEEASTMTCAGLTAWNSLMGGGKALKAGDAVITQGTGGVSVWAVQLAKAAGAEIVATTSSAAKAEVLRKLGAHHVINYKDTPEWGPQARKLLNGGQGADFVIEIAGPETIEQSLKAVHMSGTIAIIGQRNAQAGGQAKSELKLMDAFKYPCGMRRILVGSREQFEEMNRSIEVNKIKPVIDAKVFDFEDAPKAFEHLFQQQHIGNVVIQVAKDVKSGA